MKLELGCDFQEFRHYYERNWGPLGATEKKWVTEDPFHLIVWREGPEILGHAIWHHATTEEHRPGDPRDEQDRKILTKLVGPGKSFIELHELRLRREHRRKGYGKEFFDFFENFVSRKGHDLVYYAYDAAAIAICRQRGYQEECGVEAEGQMCWVFYLDLSKRKRMLESREGSASESACVNDRT